MIGFFSTGFKSNNLIRKLFNSPITQVHFLDHFNFRSFEAIIGWGCKPNTEKARNFAKKRAISFLRLEDGFLRSFGTGIDCPSLSLIVDKSGIYYDSNQKSTIETLLNSSHKFSNEQRIIDCAKSNLLNFKLSKYNHAPSLDEHLLKADDVNRILVIDQTVGDMSVKLGQANEVTFQRMLSAALEENPDASVYVKAHPEVTSGRKAGYLTHIQNGGRITVLRDAVNPLSLIDHIDKVYVVTSGMGFEALLAGKPVSVFGMPWYAGWGVTDDRQTCSRRTKKRTVDELFAAAYIHYTRYLNPVTHERGNIFDVINWLIHQKKITERYAGRKICVGFRRWKKANIKPLLSLNQEEVYFVKNAKAAEALAPTANDQLIHWGAIAPNGLDDLAKRSSARLVRLEDGFIRSVGLGSDLIKPFSLVMDGQGIYFDATKPSGLEVILNQTVFSEDDLIQSQRVRKLIIEHGVTKYNIEPRSDAQWCNGNKRVILVPGQVEDDASILLGSPLVKSNLDLLKQVRNANPNDYIVYKPHPDVTSGNRAGQVELTEALRWADHIELNLSIVSCIDACNELHTMTSLSGFDALLRNKKVVVYGEPFYAGWGLTEDICRNGTGIKRRKRRLTIDELVAGTLIKYPVYWDWDLKGYTTCEAVINRIIETRASLEAKGKLAKLHLGYIRRQWRKITILFRSWTNPI